MPTMQIAVMQATYGTVRYQLIASDTTTCKNAMVPIKSLITDSFACYFKSKYGMIKKMHAAKAKLELAIS